MKKTDNNSEGLDMAGLGKLARAIPKEVYSRSAKTITSTFEKLVAPVTESTSGLGRYIRQKFDNMVEVEKALATYTLQQAIERFEKKVEGQARVLGIAHPKAFVKSLEEASKETDPVLHEMWTNLLAAQLADGQCHPHFANILSDLSPMEAKLIVSLVGRADVGENDGAYFLFDLAFGFPWRRNATDPESHPWSYSCALLCQLGLANVLSSKKREETERFAILYRTKIGDEFLRSVSR